MKLLLCAALALPVVCCGALVLTLYVAAMPGTRDADAAEEYL